MASKKGFTLIEVIISVVILAIISTLTAANIQKSLKFKSKLDQDLADYSAVRDALIIMTQDINEAFHWVDVNQLVDKKMNEDAQKAGKGIPFPSPSPLNGVAIIPSEKLTAFVGDKESLYLTTLTHQRLVVNSLESDQAKIGYYLKDVKSLHDGKTVKSLIRRESTILDDDVTKGGKETLLLENVKSLAFKYLGGDNKEWVETWKTLNSLDPHTDSTFPNAVEIKITTERDGRTVKLSTVAAIHAPNNDPFGFNKQPTLENPGTQPTPGTAVPPPAPPPPPAGGH